LLEIRKTVQEHNKNAVAIVGSEFYSVVQRDTDTVVCQIAALSNKMVYALSVNDKALSLEKQRFSKILNWEKFGPDVPLKKISVGEPHLFRSTEIWAIRKSDDAPLRYDKSNHDWEAVNSISLLDISVSSDNAVYGVRKEDGRLVKWDGSKDFLVQDSPLTNVEGTQTYQKLTNVCALKEGKHVYSIDTETGDLLMMI
jgi:hypothetical protein